MWIVAVGNVVAGYRFYGPFVDSRDASAWAERNMNHDEWVTAEIDTKID